MATQPIDRQKSKHQHKVSARTQPQLVNRGHKRTLRELASPYVTENNRESGWNLQTHTRFNHFYR